MDEKGDKSSENQDPSIADGADKPQAPNPLDNSQPEVKTGADSPGGSSVTWEASEFIHHEKSMNWYLLLTGAAILLGAVMYLLLKDIFSLVVLAIMYAAILVYARREPRTLQYGVGVNGISIGEKHFDYDQFKSFSVIQESGVPSVVLVPTQRFMPPVSIYFAPEDADKIVGELSKFVPNEQRNLNPVDRAMLKLRF